MSEVFYRSKFDILFNILLGDTRIWQKSYKLNVWFTGTNVEEHFPWRLTIQAIRFSNYILFITFCYPCNEGESIVFGSNFPNRDFDGSARYEDPDSKSNIFSIWYVCV